MTTRGHITKMHLQDNEINEKEPLINKRKSMEDVTEIVEDILHKVIKDTESPPVEEEEGEEIF